MNLDFLKEFSKIYNLEFTEVLHELKMIIKEELNIESLFLKGNRLYESYINLDGVYKERKIRLTKKKIEKISEKLKDRLICLSNQKIKQKILDKFPYQVVEGEIIGETCSEYIVKIDNCKFKSKLPKNKLFNKKKWELYEKGLFHIKKIQIRNGNLIIILDDISINIQKYKLQTICGGVYIKKAKFLKDKIIIKSTPKINDKLKKKIEIIFNKKVIRS